MSLKPPPVKIIADSKAPASDTDSTLPLAAASYGLKVKSAPAHCLINMAHAWVLLARQAEKNFESKISETVAPKAQSI